MSNIGVIVRAPEDVDSLSSNWMPEALGARAEVEAVLESVLTQFQGLWVDWLVESAEESREPRAITVSGVFGEFEMAAIDQLCARLGARFFDAEGGWSNA